MAVFFCWLCDREAHADLCARHYENERPVFFCGEPHRKEYLWLFQL